MKPPQRGLGVESIVSEAANNGIKGDRKKPPRLMPDVEAVEKVLKP